MTNTPPIRLDNLTLAELQELHQNIGPLADFGQTLNAEEFGEPSFSLAPGLPLTMKLDYRMPHVGPGPLSVVEPPSGLPLRPAPTVAAPGPSAAAIDRAVENACNKVLPKLAGLAAAPAEIAPPPPPEAQAASGRPPAWTEEEDARLVDLVAQGIRDGQTKSAAVSDAAIMLGRPFEGTKFHLGTKLADRLTVALGAALTSARNSGADPTPTGPATDGGGGADPSPAAPDPAPAGAPTPANADWRPEAAPAATLSPIDAHLHSLPRKGGWTMELDLDLLDLAELGWSVPEIATDTGRDPRDVSARFDLLTGFDRDTKARKWPRAALLDALRGWVKSPAAAE